VHHIQQPTGVSRISVPPTVAGLFFWFIPPFAANEKDSYTTISPAASRRAAILDNHDRHAFVPERVPPEVQGQFQQE
jgi:hypothetical protein